MRELQLVVTSYSCISLSDVLGCSENCHDAVSIIGSW